MTTNSHLIYTPEPHISWPARDEVNLPDHQKMMPMWPDDTPLWKRVLRMNSRRQYMFQYDWITFIDCLGQYGIIRRNFVHDWASIPAMLRVVSEPDGVLAYGAPMHDHGYRFGGLFLSPQEGVIFCFVEFSREDLDIVLREQNNKATGLRKTNQAAYLALRAFGGKNFRPRDIATVDWSQPVYSDTGM